MSFKHDPANSLADIIENAERIQSYVDGATRDDFEENGLLRDAVERCVERNCEAAHRLGDQAVIPVPTQAWQKIRGMGNHLRHG